MAGDRREYLLKVIIIGEGGVGKSSVVRRYVHSDFCEHYKMTLGVDFALKTLEWDADTGVRLQLWDIAGQDSIRDMLRVYYKGALGAVIVYDVTNHKSFEKVHKWKEELDTKVQLVDGTPLPAVLLANKCDLMPRGTVDNPRELDNYCKEEGFVGWFETSAKENINIDNAFRLLVSKMLKNNGTTEYVDSGEFDKSSIILTEKPNNSSCC